jgi:hypothetical protein
MCEWGTVTEIGVYIQPELSFTKKGRWDYKKIDTCIADIVEALQTKDIHMRSSCCGHGKGDGGIVLQDGRIIKVEHLNA